MKFGFKISKGIMPELEGGRKKHGYDTQNKMTPNIQKHQSMLFNRSFLCKLITHYMNLQGQIPGARAPLTTKNEAPAPKFYKIEALEWQL